MKQLVWLRLWITYTKKNGYSGSIFKLISCSTEKFQIQYLNIQLCDKHLTYSILISKYSALVSRYSC